MRSDPTLGDIAAQVLDELRPIVEDAARHAAATAAVGVKVPLREGATVVSVEPTHGWAIVTPDSGGEVSATVDGELPAKGERVWISFHPDGSASVTGRQRGTARILGYAYTTGNPIAAAIGVGGTKLLEHQITVRPNQRVRVSGRVPQLPNASTTLMARLVVVEAAAELTALDVRQFAAGVAPALTGWDVLEPAAGIHLLELWVFTSTGTIDATATGALGRAAFLAEDAGNSQQA